MALSRSKAARVVQVSAGNFFEAFDLVVFGTFASIIAANFFPSSDKQLSLVLAFSTFASAYVLRFIGAVVLGPYFDHAGRRKGLILSLSLMAVGTLLIALAPPYSMAGVLGPCIVVAGRMIQGFSAGAENGGVVAYLVELAPANRKAFFASWNTTSIHLATLLAVGLGYLLNSYLTVAQLTVWGWRVPLLLGCSLIPLLFLMRRSLAESESFEAETHHPSIMQILKAVAVNWRIALTGMLMTVLSSCAFYFIFTFMPVFVKERLALSAADGLLATSVAILASVGLVPLFATLADRIGRFPILVTAAIALFVSAYPAIHYVVEHPNLTVLIVVQLWLVTLYSAYASSAFVALSEAVPSRIRATGYGVASTLGLAIFGGGTPLISTLLIGMTGRSEAPAFWLMFVALCSLAAVLILFLRTPALRGSTIKSGFAGSLAGK